MKRKNLFMMLVLMLMCTTLLFSACLPKESNTTNNTETTTDNNNNNTSNNAISVDKNEATQLLDTALENISTFAEIKQVTTTTIFGITGSSTITTTQNKQYSYESEEKAHWIVKEDSDWKIYQISYDVFDDVIEYKKLTVQTEETNLIAWEYSTFIRSNSASPENFTKASKVNNTYTITYNNKMGGFVDIEIEENKIVSTKYYSSSPSTPTSTVTFTYYQEETNSIPNILDKPWIEGGLYIKS
jgi:ABC-type oligopeptide transport system substrate-binding subunit